MKMNINENHQFDVSLLVIKTNLNRQILVVIVRTTVFITQKFSDLFRDLNRKLFHYTSLKITYITNEMQLGNNLYY
jgi:hypothetical protein